MSDMEREQVLKIASENLNIKKHSKKLNNTNKVYLTYKWGKIHIIYMNCSIIRKVFTYKSHVSNFLKIIKYRNSDCNFNKLNDHERSI